MGPFGGATSRHFRTRPYQVQRIRRNLVEGEFYFIPARLDPGGEGALTKVAAFLFRIDGKYAFKKLLNRAPWFGMSK